MFNASYTSEETNFIFNPTTDGKLRKVIELRNKIINFQNKKFNPKNMRKHYDAKDFYPLSPSQNQIDEVNFLFFKLMRSNIFVGMLSVIGINYCIYRTYKLISLGVGRRAFYSWLGFFFTFGLIVQVPERMFSKKFYNKVEELFLNSVFSEDLNKGTTPEAKEKIFNMLKNQLELYKKI